MSAQDPLSPQQTTASVDSAVRMADKPAAPQAGINEEVQRIVRDRINGSRLRSRSLIVTLLGDYASVFFPQPVQLSAIIGLLSQFGLKESLVRTTINRLLKSGWISYVKVGRNSLYSITPEGHRRVEMFSKRIYRRQDAEYGKDWSVLLIDDLPPSLQQRLRRQLIWLGYSPLTPRSFVHPGGNSSEAVALIENLGLRDKVIDGSLRLKDSRTRELALRQVCTRLPLNSINRDYANFLDTYSKVWKRQEGLGDLSASLCFALRLLMIHDYRRIILHDPDLPQPYLPPDWKGKEAHDLLVDVYACISEISTRYYSEAIKYDNSGLAAAIEQTVSRFKEARSRAC